MRPLQRSCMTSFCFVQLTSLSRDGEVFHEYCLNYSRAVEYLDSLRRSDVFCEFEKVRSDTLTSRDIVKRMFACCCQLFHACTHTCTWRYLIMTLHNVSLASSNIQLRARTSAERDIFLQIMICWFFISGGVMRRKCDDCFTKG